MVAPIERDGAALAHVPPGWSDVLTYQQHYCSLLLGTLEAPDTVYMRHLDDPYRTLWCCCSYFDAHGRRPGEDGYDADAPYIHPACDEDGNVRMLHRSTL